MERLGTASDFQVYPGKGIACTVVIDPQDVKLDDNKNAPPLSVLIDGHRMDEIVLDSPEEGKKGYVIQCSY